MVGKNSGRYLNAYRSKTILTFLWHGSRLPLKEAVRCSTESRIHQGLEASDFASSS